MPLKKSHARNRPAKTCRATARAAAGASERPAAKGRRVPLEPQHPVDKGEGEAAWIAGQGGAGLVVPEDVHLGKDLDFKRGVAGAAQREHDRKAHKGVDERERRSADDGREESREASRRERRQAGSPQGAGALLEPWVDLLPGGLGDPGDDGSVVKGVGEQDRPKGVKDAHLDAEERAQALIEPAVCADTSAESRAPR